MRRLLIVPVMTAALALTGCGDGSSDTALCDAAADYKAAIADANAAGSPGTGNAKWLAAMRKVATASTAILEAAPDEIRRDVEPFLRQLRTGDTSALQNEQLREASKRLEDYVTSTCDVELT